jgi:hypothetical protein
MAACARYERFAGESARRSKKGEAKRRGCSPRSGSEASELEEDGGLRKTKENSGVNPVALQEEEVDDGSIY